MSNRFQRGGLWRWTKWFAPQCLYCVRRKTKRHCPSKKNRSSGKWNILLRVSELNTDKHTLALLHLYKACKGQEYLQCIFVWQEVQLDNGKQTFQVLLFQAISSAGVEVCSSTGEVLCTCQLAVATSRDMQVPVFPRHESCSKGSKEKSAKSATYFWDYLSVSYSTETRPSEKELQTNSRSRYPAGWIPHECAKLGE